MDTQCAFRVDASEANNNKVDRCKTVRGQTDRLDYVVIVTVRQYQSVWCKVSARFPLEAIRKGQEFASVIHGTMNDIFLLDNESNDIS